MVKTSEELNTKYLERFQKLLHQSTDYKYNEELVKQMQKKESELAVAKTKRNEAHKSGSLVDVIKYDKEIRDINTDISIISETMSTIETGNFIPKDKLDEFITGYRTESMEIANKITSSIRASLKCISDDVRELYALEDAVREFDMQVREKQKLSIWAISLSHTGRVWASLEQLLDSIDDFNV